MTRRKLNLKRTVSRVNRGERGSDMDNVTLMRIITLLEMLSEPGTKQKKHAALCELARMQETPLIWYMFSLLNKMPDGTRDDVLSEAEDLAKIVLSDLCAAIDNQSSLSN
jgi:hypothetical protein